MKNLLLLFATLVAIQAQSSNTVQSLRVTFTDEAGATNNTTINIDADEAGGFQLHYLKDIMLAQQQTNSPPTFQNSIRTTVRSELLKPLAIQSISNEQKTNKIDLFWTYGPSLWQNKNFTAAQRQAIRDILAAPNIATNLPAQ